MEKQVLSFQELDNILRLLDASPRSGTFEIRVGDLKLKVAKGDENAAAAVPAPAAAAPAAPVAAPAPATDPAPTAAPAAREPEPAPEPAAAPAAAAPAIESGHTVRSPMTGVFYRQPSPDAPPFAAEGQRVEAGDDLAIIEVMKLMNRLSSPVSGTVRQVCAENEQLVENGAPLFVIEPDEAGDQ
ncbi:hypothetical protein JD276_08510 [Leucobacter sp. CSA1]|uniref:Biotin carboxyl carrier protein of acetyl-CoA carboxylase n=1 Tax=Leucobacter chromiisoli TaxID=2796471 RepID=A0A934UV43_9MICO|nr:biotin/lipoyl-containing protein [Leucobacter chromiisoli]MBK0419076.1 hypothetical protein [Leucobacter chromiisoli]